MRGSKVAPRWLVLVMVLLAVGCTSTGSVTPVTTAAPRERAGLVDIGAGRSLYLACRGEGSPTVVLMAGKGNGGDDWNQVLDPADPVHATPGDDVSIGEGDIHRSDDAVFPSVARFTRVCLYDRPDTRADGADRSTPRSQPHTVDLDVADLHQLMAAAHEAAPYVLVAHSYSGFIAELYTRTYPEQVAGMVLVDPGSSFIGQAVSPATLALWDAGQRATSTQAPEGVEVADAIARIEAAPPMPRLPITVLSADKPWRTDLLPPEMTQGDNMTFAQWLASVHLLAEGVGARPVTTTNSGHNIYLYSPQLVTDETRAVVEGIRANTGS